MAGPPVGVRGRGTKTPKRWGVRACGTILERPDGGLLERSLPRGRCAETKVLGNVGSSTLLRPEAEVGGCPAGLVLRVAPQGPTVVWAVHDEFVLRSGHPSGDGHLRVAARSLAGQEKRGRIHRTLLVGTFIVQATCSTFKGKK